MTTTPMLNDCEPCKTYLRRRIGALAPEIARVAEERHQSPFAVLGRFMLGVHDRHLSGLPILPEEEQREPKPARRPRLCSCLAGTFPWQQERHYEGDPGCIHEGSL